MAGKSTVLGTAILFFQGDMSKFHKSLTQLEKSATRSLKNVGRTLEKLGGGFEKLGSTMTKAGLALTGVLGGALIYSVKQAIEADTAMVRLNAALTAIGENAEKVSPAFVALAKEISKTTGYEDDMLVGIEADLLKFTNIRGPQFRAAMIAISDIAAATGQDVAAVAEMVGKALNDPAKGGRMLRTIGIALTADQQKFLADLQKSGRMSDAQNQVLNEIANRFKGAGAARGASQFGWLERLKNSVKNVAEAVGNIEVKVANKLFGKSAKDLPNQIEMVAEWLDKHAGKITDKIVAEITKTWEQVQPTLLEAWDFLQKVWEKIKGLQEHLGLTNGNLIVMGALLGPLLIILGPLVYFLGSIISLAGTFVLVLGPMLLPILRAIIGLVASIGGTMLAAQFVAAALVGSLYAFFQMWTSGDWTHNWLSDLVDKIPGAKAAIDAFFDGIVASLNWIADTARTAWDWVTGGKTQKPGALSLSDTFLGEIPSFAGGGRMPRTGLAMVGEMGPELVRLPGGSQVSSAADTRRALGDVTLNVSLNGTTIREEADVSRIAREMARLVERSLMRHGRLSTGT
ncbi:MAG: hypothetical protein WC551_11995 [Patescibacteria group bacterium]